MRRSSRDLCANRARPLAEGLVAQAQGAGRGRSALRYLAAQLTDRELEIIRLIGSGAPTREIAERLHLGRPTVETYRRRIKTKLRLQSGSKLSHEAFRWVESGGQRLT